jgi:hypothetical protein
MGRSTTRRLRGDKKRDLEVAAATAQEAVVQLHVDRAIELIQLAEGRVPTLRVLEIYIRLQSLVGPESQVVANRVMATLGRHGVRGVNALAYEAGSSPDGAETVADEEADDEEPSLLGTLRKRLRGRVNDELRHVVELHTGATRAALLDLHVRHAREFVAILADTHTIEAACDAYADRVGIPPQVGPVLYTLVLDRLAAQELPRIAPNGRRPLLQMEPKPSTRSDPAARRRQVRDAI